MGLNFEADYVTAKKNYFRAGGQTGIMNSILLSLPCLGIVCSDLFDVSGDTSTMLPYLKAATELCKSTPNSNLPVTLPSSTLGYIVAEQYNVGWVANEDDEKQVYQRCLMNIDIEAINDKILAGDRGEVWFCTVATKPKLREALEFRPYLIAVVFYDRFSRLRCGRENLRRRLIIKKECH